MERTGMISPLNMLRRHIGLAAAVLATGAAIGAGASYLIRQFRPLYRAEAVISVLSPGRQESDYEYRVSLAGKVKSRSMMQMMLDPATGRTIRETRWFRDILHEDAAEATACLETDLQAVAQRQGSYIAIAMTAASPKEAALIATEAASLFIHQQAPPPAPDEIGPKVAVLTQQQEEIEKDIRDQDAALKALRQNARDMGIIDLNASQTMDSQSADGRRLSDLEIQENEQTMSIRQLESEIESLKRLSEGPTPAQIEQTIAQDPLVISLSQQETALEIQLSGQLTRFGEDHRTVRQTKDQIDEVQGALRQRKLEISEQARQANASNLAGAGDKLRIRQERLEQLRRLRDQAQQRQATLHGVASQYEQLREKRDEQAEAMNQIKSQIASLLATPGRPATMILELARPAAEPTEMVLSRSIPLWASGGALLGLLIGIALIVLAETCNDVVRTPSDVRRFLNLPLLGVIPDACEDRAVSGIDPYHIVRDAPYSLLGEAYRYCRTNLDVSQRAALKTLLIASGNAGDGKTSLACNLAAAFAAKHETVLLIDANLRQPSLHLAFGRSGSQENGDQRRMGLTSVLTGQCDYQAAIRTSRITGLDLIYAGPPASNPAELLAGRRMKDLIENVARWYDHVIIDSPPVLLVSDVKVLAGLVDATVLVFNAATTRRGAALRTVGELQDVGGKIVGCVLFDVPALKGGYFRRQFKAYRNYVRPQLAAGSA
jgi:polysaccharide biosynthesis transport protein